MKSAPLQNTISGSVQYPLCGCSAFLLRTLMQTYPARNPYIRKKEKEDIFHYSSKKSAMKKCISFIVFIFLLLPGRPQSSKPGDLVPLLSKLAQSKPDTSRIGIFIRIAETYFYKVRLPDRMDSVVFYLKKAQQLNKAFHIAKFQNNINLLFAQHRSELYPSEDPRMLFLPIIDACKKTGDQQIEADAWMELGATIELDSASLPYKLTCYQNGLVLARKVQNNYVELRLLLFIARVHTQQQKYDLVERELFQILKEEKKAGPTIIMYACHEVTVLYMEKGEYDKALFYALKTLKMMGVSGDSYDAGAFYSRLSAIYSYLGKPAESLEWSRIDLEQKMASYIVGNYRKLNDIVNQLRQQAKPREALAFIQEQLRQQKPTDINDQRMTQRTLGDTYRDLHMDDLAEKSYVEMIRLGNQQTRNFPVWDRGYDNVRMGSFYLYRGLYQKALPFLETSLKNYEAYGLFPHLRSVHAYLYKTDSALGNYVEAIKHLKESSRLGDSIFNMTRNKQIEELQVAYKTEQKDKDFLLLKGKQKLAQVQLQHSQNTRDLTIAGAALLLIIAVLLYRLALLRKKNNRVIKNKNEQLQHLVTEKEWLLKEVHHRVKNNLHTVIGLLESQAAYLQDDALKANEISKHRIYAMSLIHQQLYNTEDIKTIDMTVYLPELLDYLGESFGIGRNIRFRLDIAPVKLGVSQAIPVGLIINEAVTNSIKYAFRPGKQGNITITMHQSADGINLVIADDGIGINPDIASAASTSMGLKLIKGLTRDIDGEIKFINENGTRIEINFKPDPLNEISTLANTISGSVQYPLS